MGAWYWIGVLVGVGTACGIAASALLSRQRSGLLVAAALGVAAGVGIGFAFFDWKEAVGGAVGGGAGALGIWQLVRGALARGGTVLGTALLVAAGAACLAGLAFVPALGYVEGLAAPLLGLRLRKQAGTRYAGLRILARD